MLVSRSLKLLSILLVVTVTMQLWLFNVGIRLIIHDILGIGIIFVFLGHVSTNSNFVSRVPVSVKRFIILSIGLYIIKLASVFGLFGYAIENTEFFGEAFSQFLLGTIYGTFALTLLVVLSIYLVNVGPETQNVIVLAFVWGIIASCFYQYAALYFVLVLGVNIDTIVWPALSFGLSSDFIIQGSGFVSDSVSTFTTFFRTGGFSSNPNSFAAQLVCVIPFLILYSLRVNKLYTVLVIIALISIAFTLSRSGLFALAVSLVMLFALEYKVLMYRFKGPILLGICFLLALGIYYGEFLFNILMLRIEGGVGTRGELNTIALQVFEDNFLLGVGYNASSVVLEQYAYVSFITGLNFHNFWAIQAVELGVVGLFYSFFLYLFILYMTAQRSNIYARSLYCSIVGLLVAGLFNNVLASFPVQVFIVIFYCFAMKARP